MRAPTPYMGQDKYIFISYSHRDIDRVYPIIAALNDRGYRVWYDSGIDPGTEWDENIAHHIDDCGYFIAMMSQNYLNSNNCKDELNYARDLEKERLLVYLEEVQLPSGMAMRLNRLQSIHQYTYPTAGEFLEKLCTAKHIDKCFSGQPMPVTASVQPTQPAPTAPSQPAQPVHTPPVTQSPPPPVRPVSPAGPVAPTPPVTSPVAASPVAPTPRTHTRKPGTHASVTSKPVKNKTLAGLMALLLGPWGVHKFYLGKPVWGAIYALITVALFVFASTTRLKMIGFIVCFIPTAVGIVDALRLFLADKKQFEKTYCCRME